MSTPRAYVLTYARLALSCLLPAPVNPSRSVWATEPVGYDVTLWECPSTRDDTAQPSRTAFFTSEADAKRQATKWKREADETCRRHAAYLTA